MLHRFVMIFDREGSTHRLLSKLWEQRIGAITYRKAVKDLWLDATALSKSANSAKIRSYEFCRM